MAVVGLRGRGFGRCRLDREVAGRRAAEQFGKQGRAVDPWHTQPYQPRSGGDQPHHAAVGHQRMAFDRHRLGTGQPGLTGIGQHRQPAGHLERIGNPKQRGRVAAPHLHAHVRPLQAGEGIFVGHIVAEIHHGAGAHPVPQRVDGVSLRRVHHGEFEHLLATLHMHLVPRGRPGEQFRHRLVAGGLVGAAVVKRDRGRLGLHMEAGGRLGDPVHLIEHPLPQADLRGREIPHKVLVELAAVRAHEHHGAGEFAELGEIGERATGDHGHMRARERGEQPHRHQRLPQGPGIGRILDDRGERAVVVGGDQQDGRAGDGLDGPLERVGRAMTRRGGGVRASQRGPPVAKGAA